MPEIDANGTTLTYLEQGQGEPLVLVHGSISDYRSWEPQVAFFSQYYRVIAYSRRYHYPRPWTGNGPGWAAALHAADLAALVERLGLDRIYLVGHSYGALTSLLYAESHQDAVRSMVLGEPPILPWLNTMPGGKPVFDAFMNDAWLPATQAFQTGDQEAGVRAFVNGISGAPVFDQMPEAARRGQLDNAASLHAETVAAPADYYSVSTCEDAARVTAPVLLVGGERSPRMFGMILDALERCLPNCRRVTIPAASHSMARANPAAFNEAVLAFLLSTAG